MDAIVAVVRGSDDTITALRTAVQNQTMNAASLPRDIILRYSMSFCNPQS